MSESDKSRDFIKKQKKLHGKHLKIEKIIRPDKSGEPDIFAIYKGMPVYMEAKYINPISMKNTHPFTLIQLDTLKTNANAGAMCIGLLHCSKSTRFIMYDKLTEYLDRDAVESAQEFQWQTLLLLWMANIQTNF